MRIGRVVVLVVAGLLIAAGSGVASYFGTRMAFRAEERRLKAELRTAFSAENMGDLYSAMGIRPEDVKLSPEDLEMLRSLGIQPEDVPGLTPRESTGNSPTRPQPAPPPTP